MAQPQLGAPDLPKPSSFWFSQVRQMLTYIQITTALDFGNTAAQNSALLTVTMPGVSAGDFAEMSPPAAPANSCFVIDSVINDGVVIRFCNFSAGAINPGSLSFNIRVWKQ